MASRVSKICLKETLDMNDYHDRINLIKSIFKQYQSNEDDFINCLDQFTEEINSALGEICSNGNMHYVVNGFRVEEAVETLKDVMEKLS